MTGAVGSAGCGRETAPVVVTLTRAVIRVQSVKSKVIEPGYGWVRVSQFQESTAEHLVRHLTQGLGQRDGVAQGAVHGSREHLSRQFAAGGAPNLKRVIDLTRVACAAQLLANPGYTIPIVVRLLHFASSSHLSGTAAMARQDACEEAAKGKDPRTREADRLSDLRNRAQDRGDDATHRGLPYCVVRR